MLDSAKEDPGGLASFIGIAWVYGLVLTIFVGLPLGFLVAFFLRRTGREGPLAYTLAAAMTAFAFSMVLPSRSEFWLAITVTGLLLGVSYWLFVRRPLLQRSEPH
jgi:NhaP-type Na+/H+ or K+/H+ antiporter